MLLARGDVVLSRSFMHSGANERPDSKAVLRYWTGHDADTPSGHPRQPCRDATLTKKETGVQFTKYDRQDSCTFLKTSWVNRCMIGRSLSSAAEFVQTFKHVAANQKTYGDRRGPVVPMVMHGSQMTAREESESASLSQLLSHHPYGFVTALGHSGIELVFRRGIWMLETVIWSLTIEVLRR